MLSKMLKGSFEVVVEVKSPFKIALFDGSIIILHQFSPFMNIAKHVNVHYMFDTCVLRCSKIK